MPRNQSRLLNISFVMRIILQRVENKAGGLMLNPIHILSERQLGDLGFQLKLFARLRKVTCVFVLCILFSFNSWCGESVSSTSEPGASLLQDLNLLSINRKPQGIYAVVTPNKDIDFSILVSNPAVSGLAVRVDWATLNSEEGVTPDWSYLDNAFTAIQSWNTANPSSTPKTVQLEITPGFGTPNWVLDKILSCDGLFAVPRVDPTGTCGKATFPNSEGSRTTTPQPLPLPWDSTYKSQWKKFLMALAERYGQNPTLVSIAVAGPTATSVEMILPATNDVNSATGLTLLQTWRKLIANPHSDPSHYLDPDYIDSDKIIIDAWEDAIDMYGKIFSGITLVVTSGDGLPKLGKADVTIPAGFEGDCTSPDPDCAAETTIESYFEQPSVGGTNSKATQTSGVEAAKEDLTINMSLKGVKFLSEATAHGISILGGAQFNTSFSLKPVQEGCTSKFPPKNNSTPPPGCVIPSDCTTFDCIPVACIPSVCITSSIPSQYKVFSDVPSSYLISPEQALNNVLSYYFSDTSVANLYGGIKGTAPMNYMQIYAEDIKYATDHAISPPVTVTLQDGTTISVTAQDELNSASQRLLQISKPLPPPHPIFPKGTPPDSHI
jgi:hypothetical protein